MTLTLDYDWFKDLTGFEEPQYPGARKRLSHDKTSHTLTTPRGTYTLGDFETPFLGELRIRAPDMPDEPLGNSLKVQKADVQSLMESTKNANATFQAASQFNLLEAPHWKVPPSEGISAYQYDMTQGPACAMSCGAATLYRAYMCPEMNMLEDVEKLLAKFAKEKGCPITHFWEMRNGYLIPSKRQLKVLNSLLDRLTKDEREHIKECIRVGVHWNTQVTSAGDHTVTQVLCSALPLGYSKIIPALWEPFARMVLEAAYEATLRVAMGNKHDEGGKSRVYLTLLGAGAFRNPLVWVSDAIQKAVKAPGIDGLEVIVIRYGDRWMTKRADYYMREIKKIEQSFRDKEAYYEADILRGIRVSLSGSIKTNERLYRDNMALRAKIKELKAAGGASPPMGHFTGPAPAKK